MDKGMDIRLVSGESGQSRVCAVLGAKLISRSPSPEHSPRTQKMQDESTWSENNKTRQPPHSDPPSDDEETGIFSDISTGIRLT